MSFPRYPKYKDSGVEWLGQVPEHWEAIRYKNVFEEKFVGANGSLPLGSISFGRVVFKSDVFFNEATKATYQQVQAGEFLINPINLNYDLKSLRTALSEINTCVSPAYIVLKAKGARDNNFLKHQLHAFDLFHMKTLGAGVRQTITFDDIGACQTYLPPLPEQTRIAAFLDQETAKIDELVAEQQRLMALLKEKRQAVISHAVTKGLNPKAPMKPSGIEWLGQVPAHWETKPLKAVAKLFGRIGFRGYTTEDIVDEGEGAVTLSPSNMVEGKLALEKCTFISWAKYNESPEIQIVANNVLIVKTGSTFGKTAFVDRVDQPMTINPQIAVFKNIICAPRFLFHVLNTPAIQSLIEISNKGSTIPTMTQEAVGNFWIGLPPHGEQIEIVAFIDAEQAQLNELTAEAQRAIDLLQERRTALISAAVTGQIDVRGN